jgi:phage repressor protein C with HTH and peptisase S24 domain
MGLGSRIRELRLRRGWKLQQLEEASGVDMGTISAIERRDSSRSDHFPALARALGVTLEQLSEPEFSGNAAEEPRPAYGLAPIFAWEHTDDLPAGEYVMIPRLDVQLSAGSGREQLEIGLMKDNPQAFRAEWIRLMKLKPNKLAAMRAHGNSMEPTIHDGDSLLVDTSQTTVGDGKVYALWYDGGERVKRLFRLPGGGLRIKSDNPTFETIDLNSDYAGHVRIIGRVVHRSGMGGL